MAGYSKKSLVDKLGIKSGQRVILLNAPKNYPVILGLLPPVKLVKQLRGQFDFIQLFVTQKTDLTKQLSKIKSALQFTGTLWISWPKQTSKMDTDLNENIVRNLGLQAGLVDVKVCAVDEIWSGLKFVYRLKDRPTK